MTTPSVTITLICTNFPGEHFDECEALQVGLQVGRGRGFKIVDAVAGNAREARFTAIVQVHQQGDGSVDFRGPVIQGKVGERFLYLVWTCAADRQTPLRRVKVPLHHLTWADLQNGQLVARLQMTGPDGNPLAATPQSPYLSFDR